MKKILHVSYSDLKGGASRAGYRIFRSILDYKSEHYEIQMLVIEKQSKDPQVASLGGRLVGFFYKLRPGFRLLMKPFFYWQDDSVINSYAALNSRMLSVINSGNFDLVNLHWILGETLSVSDISRIKIPVVWTMHDMWAMLGTEHYSSDKRYLLRNPITYYLSKIIDINYIVFMIKMKKWQNKQFQIVCPSRWLYELFRSSKIFINSMITLIPYSIDINYWHPCKSNIHLGHEYGVDSAKKIILFGAVNAITDKRKGFHLLVHALIALHKQFENFQLIVFGSECDHKLKDQLPFDSHFLGSISDQSHLLALYQSAHVFVLPSLIDNLPNTALEAQATGCPVVAFEVGGIPDIVEHGVTGYLAKSFDIADLSAGISYCLKNRSRLSIAAREKAMSCWSPKKIALSYLDLYSKILDRDKHAT